MLRALWRFRLTHVALKPEVDPEADFLSFATLIRGGLQSWVLRGEDGAIHGMTHFIAAERCHDGARFVYLLPEYIYIDPAYRKGFSLLGSALRMLWRCLRRWPRLPLYTGGPGYLSGYLMLCQIADPVWLWRDPRMSRWQAEAFASIAAEHPGWDANTGIVTMKTRPLFPRSCAPTGPRGSLRSLSPASMGRA